MPEAVWRWSAVETAAAIRDGLVTSEQVVQAHIERMHAVNPALNAVVRVVRRSASCMACR